MLSKDQMKKITGGYSPCDAQSYMGPDVCRMMGGYWLGCQSAECGYYFMCNAHWGQGCPSQSNIIELATMSPAYSRAYLFNIVTLCTNQKVLSDKKDVVN